MPATDEFDWRDRAMALASLGAVALRRTVLETADVLGERPMKPVEMQVLVALALRDSLAEDPPQPWVAERIVGGLERAELVRRAADSNPLGEVQSTSAERRARWMRTLTNPRSRLPNPDCRSSPLGFGARGVTSGHGRRSSVTWMSPSTDRPAGNDDQLAMEATLLVHERPAA